MAGFLECQLIQLRVLLLMMATMMVVMVSLIQVAEVENGHGSPSDESGPEDVEPKLLRKQLLEVSGIFCHQPVSVSD